MIGSIKFHGSTFTIDLSKPLDLSIGIGGDDMNVNAWNAAPARISPHREANTLFSVAEGAAVNFNDISFNPHAHGTHTECVGHITKEVHSVNRLLRQFFFQAEVLSVAPEKQGTDLVISAAQLQAGLKGKKPGAVVLRTLPNSPKKRMKKYSDTNPPYLHEEAARFLADSGIEHLLTDLPSVDREKDGGALRAHRAFWNVPQNPRMHATITEFIYVPNRVKDGSYILNLQTAAFDNDAAPSRPVLFKIVNT